MNIYPWQKSSWDELFLNKSAMPHAFIFYGTQTIEINSFVTELVRSIYVRNLLQIILHAISVKIVYGAKRTIQT